MQLVGTYVNIAQNFKLVITDANDANGEGKGIMHWGKIEIPVSMHYHFEKNVGPVTDLIIWGFKGDPNQFFTGSGSTNNRDYKTINIGMSLATGERVVTFHTILDRQ